MARSLGAKERKWKDLKANADNTTATTAAAPSLNAVNAAVPAVKDEDLTILTPQG